MAIKNAVTAARQENGYSSDFRFDSPATVEKIRLACQDNLTKKVSFSL